MSEIKTFEELVEGVKKLLGTFNVREVDSKKEAFDFYIEHNNCVYTYYSVSHRRVFYIPYKNSIKPFKSIGSISIHNANASYKGIYNIIKALKGCEDE